MRFFGLNSKTSEPVDRWEQYFLEPHSEIVLRRWAKRLSFFRFFRAYGGHANDADALVFAFRYKDFEELETMLSKLDIVLVKHLEEPRQPEPNTWYSHEEFQKFPWIIEGSRWIEQPSIKTIVGQKVHVFCEKNLAKISMGSGYDGVTELDVQNAEVVEKLLCEHVFDVVDPPFDSKHYLCPKFHPSYFSHD
jgi:hypothetical protein